jgi:hypothetical protein
MAGGRIFSLMAVQDIAGLRDHVIAVKTQEDGKRGDIK